MNNKNKISIQNIKIWEKYTNENRSVDFSGNVIEKCAFGDVNSKYGWNVDHVLPKSKSKKNRKITNLQPLNIKTNSQKFDKMNGEIIHKYCLNLEEVIVKTKYEVYFKDNNEGGIIKIIEQTKNNSLIIRNIFFEDECGFYECKDGNFKYSYIDLYKSIENRCLYFLHGNKPELWPKIN